MSTDRLWKLWQIGLVAVMLCCIATQPPLYIPYHHRISRPGFFSPKLQTFDEDGWFTTTDLILNNRAHACDNLELIGRAVLCHDAIDTPFIEGAKLEHLSGKYLSCVPLDCWRRDYLFDPNIEFIGTYGADGLPGGIGDNRDVCSHYGTALTIKAAFFDGNPGVPKLNDRIILWIARDSRDGGSRPFEVVDAVQLLKGIVLLADPIGSSNGKPVSLFELNSSGPKECRHSWTVQNRLKRVNSREALVLVNNQDVAAGGQEIKPGMAVNFDLNKRSCGDDTFVRFGIRELWIKGGPLDPEKYGPGVKKYWRTPTAVPKTLIDGMSRNLGCRLEDMQSWRKASDKLANAIENEERFIAHIFGPARTSAAIVKQ